MRRMLERLAGGALFAAAMMLAGCVAQTGDADDESVADAPSGLVEVPDIPHPDLPGTVQVDEAAGNAVVEQVSGSDNTGEPEPNPWKPGMPGPTPGDPGTRH